MIRYITILMLLSLVATSCRNQDYIDAHNYTDSNDDEEYDPELADIVTFPDWTESTHSNAVDPNFDEVFPQDKVQRLDITISSSNWSTMWSDLSSNLGSNRWGATSTVDFTPVWVPSTITYNDTDWYQVGIRFKGNSSLSQTYSSGNSKLSLKLDFDQYENEYPALTNQRFYGFKQLNLNNNYEDESFMREKVAPDLFRQFGMAAANTSFCAVYINGDYYGLYTMVEEVDDTVIKTQFSDGSGNTYKPEDDAGSFAQGTYDTDEFYLKTNTDNPNYSDVQSLYDTLHSSDRTSNEEAWKVQLESVFNVEVFMKWLAVITTIQNWDSYGNMAHNYYLYNNPDNNQLTWIPWDHNEAFQNATGNYTTYTPEQLASTRYVGSSWPLISYLIAVDEYKQMFDSYLKEFIEEVFNSSTMTSTYESYYNLIKEYAYSEVSGRSFLSNDSQFDSAVSTLKSHAQSRVSVIESYLY